MEVCDECNGYMHEDKDLRFHFFQDDFDERRCLCLECFDNMFGVVRYAKFVAKNPFCEEVCCCCHQEINTQSEIYYSIRASNDEINVGAHYCSDCYSKDVGAY